MTISTAAARAHRAGSGMTQRTRWLASVLAPNLPSGGPVIELGAGGLTDILGLWCVEREAALAYQVKRGAAIAEPARLPFRDNCATALVATSPRPFADPAAFAEAHRVLQPTGRLLLALPDPEPPLDDPIRALLMPMRAALNPVSPREARERLIRDAEATGFGVATQPLPPRPYWQSPAQEAQDLITRASSILWEVDEATWAQVVAPTIDALLRRPDPDRPVRRNAYYSLLTLSKAARAR